MRMTSLALCSDSNTRLCSDSNTSRTRKTVSITALRSASRTIGRGSRACDARAAAATRST